MLFVWVTIIQSLNSIKLIIIKTNNFDVFSTGVAFKIGLKPRALELLWLSLHGGHHHSQFEINTHTHTHTFYFSKRADHVPACMVACVIHCSRLCWGKRQVPGPLNIICHLSLCAVTAILFSHNPLTSGPDVTPTVLCFLVEGQGACYLCLAQSSAW